jgi:hypothetical protein
MFELQQDGAMGVLGVGDWSSANIGAIGLPGSPPLKLTATVSDSSTEFGWPPEFPGSPPLKLTAFVGALEDNLGVPPEFPGSPPLK